MKKSRSAKGVNHLLIAQALLALMKWMYDFRIKYDFTEASMWDVIFIHIHYMEQSKGMSITALMMQRYRRATGYKALRQRLDILIKRGLIIQENRRMFPAEIILNELATLNNPESLKLISSISAA